MPQLAVRVNDELAARFAAVAAANGGTSALLRKLVLAVTGAQGDVPSAASADSSTNPDASEERLSARFGGAEAARIRERARREGISVSSWLRAAALDKVSDAPAAAGSAEDTGGQGSEPDGSLTARVTARLTAAELARLRQAAQARGMVVSHWLRALIVARFGRPVQYSNAERAELHALSVGVRKIGTNLNQMTRAMNTARKLGKPLPLDLAQVEAAKAVVTESIETLRQLSRGTAQYWEAGA